MSMCTTSSIRSTARSWLPALALLLLSGMSYALEDKLVIVTSLPKDLTDPFNAAFQRMHPGTRLEILNKNTSAGVTYIEETVRNNSSDLFWVSAPDAFTVLKSKGLLQRYQPNATGIPDNMGSFPINDPDGYFFGFAASGYGIMYNTRYLKAKKLPAPREWHDLTRPVYYGHVGMSAPSRSGTTHLTVEVILQGEGWKEGWGLIKAMAGNFKTITERSFGVPDGVNSGAFGIGIVIDYFGYTSKASGFPVEFVYPTNTALVPASVGMVEGAPHPKAAGAFIDFLLSDQGQEILFDPRIQRLPVKPAIYAKAPPGLPDPFKDRSIGATIPFDARLSEARYNVINSLFDHMITFRSAELRAATKAIDKAQKALVGKPNADAQALVAEARSLVAATPVTEAQASDPAYAAIFEAKQMKPSDAVPQRQAKVEQQWDRFIRRNYQDARQRAEQALSTTRKH